MLSARRALPSDLDLVRTITNTAYQEYVQVLGAPPLPMTEDYAPHIEAGDVWLVSRAEHILGLTVLETHSDHLMIFSLAVLPDAQGAGVGRWMLNFAEDLARAAGLPEVRLYTNSRMERNIRVYEQAGYVRTGVRPNPRRPGWWAVDMAKTLRSPT